ncbi:MAG: PQQ-dependent sugar dehydrogenase [Planctomycetes bacterium]|nr:PQQ-dependent sugar dehydrogenase [Planctomycetota bacterium]
MRRLLTLLAIMFSGLFLYVAGTTQADDAPKDKAKGQAKGQARRVLWTTSKVIGSPEPPPAYKTEPAFPKLMKFNEPLDMASAPGTNRLFIAERYGKIYSFINKKDVAKADLAWELKGAKDSKGEPMKQSIYAITLHPKFKDNGYIYVTWIPNPETERQPKGSRVSRYTVKGDPPVLDAATEKIIFEWPNGGHNGGCLKFGRDDMLYIVTGDGSGIADENNIGQDLSSIHAKLLRIDVDHPDSGKSYSIPKDNPFVKTPKARPEIWAYGLRQLWRYSFDRKTGDLWGGEVGQDLWEMIYRVQKGGNYGWSVQEGTHPFRPERKMGPTPILTPVVEHDHAAFRSITGGFVYHGARSKDLEGTYLYGDFDSGRIWGLRYDAGKLLSNQELARTTYRIVSWGEDNDGEVYFLDFTGGGIHQLVKAPPDTKSQAAFPRKLSETGIFTSTKDHTPAPGLIAYTVNSQLWGDHTCKERFLAIPGNGQIGLDEITYPQPSPGAPPGWRFPDGTVLVKTFSMQMERGNPASKKRLETRLLHFQQFPGTQEYGDQYWRGYTYVWNDEQTDAELLDEKGMDKKIVIKDAKAPGGQVVQNYRFPSRAECTGCHTNAAKFALGVSTMQMNRDHDYNGKAMNQLAMLESIGVFTKPLPSPPEKLAKLVDYNDSKASTEDRARAYLHSNCAHCHIKWGGGNAEFKLLATLPLKEMGIVNVPPAHGSFDIKSAKLLVPGHPEQSIIHYRMAATGLGRMPHIASRVVDDVGLKLVHDWIKGMPAK